MNWLSAIAGSKFVQSLGWALVHFLWQGGAIALGLAAVLVLLRNKPATSRYFACCFALVVSALCPIATCIYLYGSNKSDLDLPSVSKMESSDNAARSVDTQVKPDQQSHVIHSTSSGPNLPWVSLLVVGWAVVVIVRGFRLFDAWLQEERYRSFGVELADDELHNIFSKIARQLQVTRPVVLLLSSICDVPMVIGWLRPTLLLPAALITTLTPKEIDALLAHELGHIRRHDYVVHFVQQLIETLLFYHPVVWWISHQTNLQREYCCDDIATEVGDKATCAQALMSLNKWRFERFHFAMAATGTFLEARVARLRGLDYAEPSVPIGFRKRVIRFTTVIALIVLPILIWQTIQSHYQSASSVAVTNTPLHNAFNANALVAISALPLPFDHLPRSDTNPREILWDGEQILKFYDSVQPGVTCSPMWVRTPIKDPLQIIVIFARQSPHSSLVVEWRKPAGDWTSDNDGGSGRGGRHQIILGQRWIGDTIRLNVFPDSSHDFDRPAGGDYIVCVRRLKHVNDIDPETIGAESSPIVLNESGKAMVPTPRFDAKGAPIVEHLRIDYPGDTDVFLLGGTPSGLLFTVRHASAGANQSVYIYDSRYQLLSVQEVTSLESTLSIPASASAPYYAAIAGTSAQTYQLTIIKE